MISISSCYTLERIEDSIKAGGDVNAKNDNGMTPLMCVARHNLDYRVIEALIKAGADVNTQDNEGMTALIHAAKNTQNSDIIFILLSHGAEAKLKDIESNTALYYARGNKYLRKDDLRELEHKTMGIDDRILHGA